MVDLPSPPGRDGHLPDLAQLFKFRKKHYFPLPPRPETFSRDALPPPPLPYECRLFRNLRHFLLLFILIFPPPSVMGSRTLVCMTKKKFFSLPLLQYSPQDTFNHEFFFPQSGPSSSSQHLVASDLCPPTPTQQLNKYPRLELKDPPFFLCHPFFLFLLGIPEFPY